MRVHNDEGMLKDLPTQDTRSMRVLTDEGNTRSLVNAAMLDESAHR